MSTTPPLMTSSQVESKYGIARAELLAYERAGKLSAQRTAGGHRRYSDTDVVAILSERTTTANPTRKPNIDEMGVSALNKWGGTVYEEPLGELRGLRGRTLLREMHWNDPVISAVFFAIEAAMKEATWRIKPASELNAADKDAAKFVEECLGDMNLPWSDILDQIVDPMLEQGFTLMEVVYKRRKGSHPGLDADNNDLPESKYSDGKIGWHKWALRPAESLTPGNEWIFNKHGDVLGCNQTDPETGENIVLPATCLLHFRTTSVPANTPEGRPVHRSMATAYYYGRNFQELEGIGAERDLQGVAVIYLGNDCNLSADDPNSDFNLAKDLVTNLHRDEQAGVVIPRPKLGTSSEGNGMLLELLSASSSRAHDVGAIIDRYDRLKAVSVLAQFIMLGMQRSGSYALATAQSDLFTMAVAAWLRKIEDVINHTAIPRLMSYNAFPGITGNPTIVFSDVGLPNLEALSWYINALVSNNLIRPDDELEKHLRQIAHLPPPEPNSAMERSYSQIDPTESALLIRRVLLALKELPSYEGMTDEQLATLVDPLINQLRLGIEGKSGIKIPQASAPSVEDSSKRAPMANTLAGPPDANAGGVAPSPAPKVAETPSPKATAPRKAK